MVEIIVDFYREGNNKKEMSYSSFLDKYNLKSEQHEKSRTSSIFLKNKSKLEELEQDLKDADIKIMAILDFNNSGKIKN